MDNCFVKASKVKFFFLRISTQILKLTVYEVLKVVCPSKISSIPLSLPLQVLSAAMYGYGYSRPWQDAYEPPLLDCGHKEFEEALQEYAFLDNPDPENDISILVYYTTELNHVIKNKLYCIVSFELISVVLHF